MGSEWSYLGDGLWIFGLGSVEGIINRRSMAERDSFVCTVWDSQYEEAVRAKVFRELEKAQVWCEWWVREGDTHHGE